MGTALLFTYVFSSSQPEIPPAQAKISSYVTLVKKYRPSLCAVRTAFNNRIKLDQSVYRDYYSSPFFVFNITELPNGDIAVDIVFVNKPDKYFTVVVDENNSITNFYESAQPSLDEQNKFKQEIGSLPKDNIYVY